VRRAYWVLSIGYCVAACILLGGLRTEIYAQPISSAELIKNAKFYDGKSVSFAGEVVGDVMIRGDFAWLNIYDGANAIGVWVPEQLARQIGWAGDYKTKGDVVEVSGIIHSVCLEHGGDFDIHALSVRRIYAGRQVRERFNQSKGNVALWLLGVLCLVMILRQLKRK